MNETSFIFGVPRSGTTLLANIVNSHPKAICLLEPYLSLNVHNNFFHEDYGKLYDKEPIEFLETLSKHGSFKETFRSKWINSDLENDLSKFTEKVDYSIAIVRDIRAVWCSTFNVWNEGRKNIDIYYECWNDFYQFVLRNQITFVKYEEIVSGSITPNEIFRLLGLCDVEEFQIQTRESQAGDTKANSTDKIRSDSLDKWKDVVDDKNKKLLKNKCKDGLKYFGYI